jgi:glucosamine 6-phosphate synthetase-like amidotransferase/phosphosugar isomerase protein
MCGIVGYVGPNVDDKALDVVMEGLARLEYRGYDSAGVALVTDGGVATEKRAGKLENLRRALETAPARGVAHRHRAHPVGHPRRPDRRQRPPAPGWRGRQASP